MELGSFDVAITSPKTYTLPLSLKKTLGRTLFGCSMQIDQNSTCCTVVGFKHIGQNESAIGRKAFTVLLL